ncbi:methyltransferase [Strigomonas culicis]|nr:methyltransferase [Strigomonas culicis]EPY24926.1 tRNA (guanine-N7-)-methyltransferase [Strigomonas culicis]EPY36391.1 methyltransferase [Strigomonas culicis]|eukprot:EPY23069.1 methyltransferase [Strigomonas culicis]
MSSFEGTARWTRLPIRTRPHRNPLADNDDEHPESPGDFTEKMMSHYPNMNATVEVVDVGCAFGGMLFRMAPLFPTTCMLGLEIRPKVVAFAQEKVTALRVENAAHLSEHYRNIWFEQLNVMKYGSNCFTKGQLKMLFFCYPDPHWKRKNIRRRIISPSLVQEYAYWLRVGGLLFTVSDVEGLETWMTECLDACPLFRRLTDDEVTKDPRVAEVLEIAKNASEDAQRTERKGLNKFFAIHIRIKSPHYAHGTSI